MSETTTSYGLTADFDCCAAELRGLMRKNALQVIQITNIVNNGGLCGPDSYFLNCYRSAKLLGRKLSLFIADVFDAADDDALCMGVRELPGGTNLYLLFCYDGTEEPTAEMLMQLAGVLAFAAGGRVSTLTLEGMAETSDVACVLQRLCDHAAGDWGKVARALVETGEVAVEVMDAEGAACHVIKEPRGDAARPQAAPSPVALASPADEGALCDVVIPGVPPFAYVDKRSTASREQVERMRSKIRVIDWPRLCDELSTLTGHAGTDEEGWLAVVAGQLADARVVMPAGDRLGYAEMRTLFDMTGRPLFAILRSSSDASDVRPVLDAIVNHEGAAALVPVGLGPQPDRTFHAFDYLSYLRSRAEFQAQSLRRSSLERLTEDVCERMPVSTETFEHLAEYQRAWSEIGRVLEGVGRGGVSTLSSLGPILDEWTSRVSVRSSKRAELREVVEECAENFRAVAPWGHPVIQSDLELLDSSEGVDEKELEKLEEVYTALVEEMARDEPYEERGQRLALVEKHFMSLGGLFEALRAAFEKRPVSLAGLRRGWQESQPSEQPAEENDAEADAAVTSSTSEGTSSPYDELVAQESLTVETTEDAGTDGVGRAQLGDAPDVPARDDVSEPPDAGGLLLDEMVSFRPREAQRTWDDLSEGDDLFSDLVAEETTAEPLESQKDLGQDADVRELFPEECGLGRQTGVPCDFEQLFELGSRSVWPAGEAPSGAGPLERCAFMGRRGPDDLLSCAEAVLQDGLRQSTARRVLEPLSSRSSGDDAEAGRLWALCVLADWLGIAAGNDDVGRLAEECEWLALGSGSLRPGPALSLLVAEAFLAATTSRLTGEKVEEFRSYLGRLEVSSDIDAAVLRQLDGILAHLDESLGGVRGFDPKIDYSTAVVPLLVRMRREESLASVRDSAQELRDTKIPCRFVPAQSFWRDYLMREDVDSRLMVGPLISDMTEGSQRSGVDMAELEKLRDDVRSNVEADYRDFREKGNVEADAREALVKRCLDVYRCYARYLELVREDSSGYVDRSLDSVAADLDNIAKLLLKLLRGLDDEGRGPWAGVIERAEVILRAYPSPCGAPREATEGVSDTEDDNVLPSSLRTEAGRALFEVLMHISCSRGGGSPRPVTPSALEERLLSTRKAVDRAFTFNVIDGNLHGLLGATLSRTAGVIDALGSYDESDRAMRGLMADWTLELIETRVAMVVRATLSRAEDLLAERSDLDEAARENLRNAVDDGDLARVFAYTDYELDNAILEPTPAPSGYEDEFYGSGPSRPGLVDKLCRSFIEGRTAPAYRELPFEDAFSPSGPTDRADRAASSFKPLRKGLGRLREEIREHLLPLNGSSVSFADGAASDSLRETLDDVARILARIFEELGFEDAKVSPAVSYADVAGAATGWRLRFYARPSGVDSHGELVCPLREFVVLMDPEDGVGPARVEYQVELFTSMEELGRAMKHGMFDVGLKRLALYVPVSARADTLTLHDRQTLMAARLGARDSRADGMLLLDEVLISYLASVPLQGGDRLAAFFRCALPFTAPLPYGDDTRMSMVSDVHSHRSILQPPLFYGRSTILGQLRERGKEATFIYGARRMGKTSILREFAAEERAARNAPSSTRHEGTTACVSYVDVQGRAGMGLDNFWRQIVGRGFMGDVPALANAIGEADVQRALSEASDGERFYLLIDEADDLIRYDSLIYPGHPQNAIMNSLVSYMQRNQNFRVIMGGLHVTMRYADETARSNQKVGQLSRPVVVGPLWEGGAYKDAARLVWEPLKAMGYLMRREDVLKVLNKACYFPNLINIICERLLVTLRQRLHPDERLGEFFVRVPSSVVEQAMADVSEDLAAQFRLTIQLDPGYDVIIYALAALEARSREEGAERRAFTIDEILEQVDAALADVGAESVRDAGGSSSSLLDILRDDEKELESFGILKCVDDLVSLRDGSMRSLVGMRSTLSSALMSLRAACRRCLDRDGEELDMRFDSSESRNNVMLGELALFSPLNARDVREIDGKLRALGHCVLSVSLIAGANLLAAHFTELLPELCQRGAPVVVEGAALNRLLDEMPEAPLVVASDGWGEDVLARLRDRGAGRGCPVLLLASPRTVWVLREQLLSANDLVVPTPWSDLTCRQWVRCYIEAFERSSGGTLNVRVLGELMKPLMELCGGQAGAVAQVVDKACGGATLSGQAGAVPSVLALEQEIRAFSSQALEGPDFSWIGDEKVSGASVISWVWKQLAGLAAPSDSSHPFEEPFSSHDWYGLVDDGKNSPTEQEVAAVLCWMETFGLARPVHGEQGDLIGVTDWFMHALLTVSAGECDAS